MGVKQKRDKEGFRILEYGGAVVTEKAGIQVPTPRNCREHTPDGGPTRTSAPAMVTTDPWAAAAASTLPRWMGPRRLGKRFVSCVLKRTTSNNTKSARGVKSVGGESEIENCRQDFNRGFGGGDGGG